MTIVIAAECERGTFHLSVDLTIARGHVQAIVGENGAGKSTLMHLLAGTLAPSRGTLTIADRELSRGGERPHVVPPERRRIGMLSQDPLLFPHLTAQENIAFGPRSAGMPAHRARSQASRWLERVGLPGAEGRWPHELSGGEQQRVALARALATEPDVLLLDEPLAALDVTTAPQIRQLLTRELSRTGVTAVLVSHNVVDVLALADEVAVLETGQLVETGTPAEVFQWPRTRFAAALAGMNLLTHPDTGDLVRIQPHEVDVVEDAQPQTWPARVEVIEPATTGVRMELTLADGARVVATMPAAAGARYDLGDRVFIRLPQAVHS